MEDWQIVFLDSRTVGSDIDLSCIGNLGQVTTYEYTPPETVGERIRKADVVITNKVPIGERELAEAQQLKLVALTATGVNNIDLDAAVAYGVGVCNVAGYSTASVAQHTFALLLSYIGQIPYHDQYVKRREYSRSGMFTHLERPAWELQGRQWGIIGLGAIGSAVAGIAEAFGCSVAFFSTSGEHSHDRYERVSLDTLLRESDIVSIHAPLNERTRGLIGQHELENMRQHAVLLNLARGGIVDEAALAQALDKGTIGGAAFDVFRQEPPGPDSPLLNLAHPERILLSPHNAWSSHEARTRLISELCENIVAFKQGKPRNRVV
ncbi:MAG: D-2-hydroxyacid dehydrogenase [Spirochaetia bacterium]